MNAPLPPIATPSPPRDANRWLVAACLACASVAGGSAVFGLMVWRAPGETTPVLAAVAAFFLALTLGAFLLWRRQSYAALERELAAERQRKVLADRLALVTRHANDIILLLDETGRIVEANDRALITSGYTLDQLRALPPGSLRSPAAMENLTRHLDLLRSRDGTIFETIHRRKDGTTFPVEVSGRAVEIEGRQFILGIYRDLTQRKAYEREIERLNRLYLALSQVNQAIVRTSTSPQEMLEAVCREMAHHGQFRLVWIGCHDEAQRRVQPVAWAGEDQQFLDGLDIYTDERAEAHGPTGTAVREGRGVVFNDLTADPRQTPWRERVRQFGFESAGAFSIRLRGRVWGSLTVYAREAGFFRDKEVSLLQEVAGDISFALDHGESEARRRQLETHNRQLAAIVEASDDAIVSRTLDGTIISWNKGAERIYGYTEAELVGRPIGLLVPPGGEDELAGINERLGRGDPIPPFETARRCKDGREVHVAVTVSPLCDADGRVIGAATVARDVTARVQAEAALRESEAEIQCILGSTADGILAIDNNGEVIHANRRFAELWRIPQSLMKGHDDQELLDFVLDQLNEPEAFLKKVRLLYKSDQEGWDTLVFKDGRVFERYSSPLISSTSLVGRVWSFRDITERKQAEARIREQAELLDKANEAIVVADLGNLVTFWNRGAARLFGWTAAEMIGKPVSEVLALGGGANGAEAHPAIAAIGDWRGEICGHNRNGDPLIIETSITVIRDEAERPTGRLSISTDITEKKKLAEHILRVQRLESIGMLAAGIAHDLNNVLAPIGMTSALLRNRVSASADLRLLDTLEKCADRGTRLVRQILGFAHGIGGEPRLAQIKHLLRDITDVITETFPKSIFIDENIPSDLWPVMANPTQIHQVLLNLCLNARDAMPRGGTLCLRGENCVLDAEAAQAIEGAKPGAWLVLEVKDTGTGMPPDVLARIWEPFFTTKSADKGTGLGLSTVRGIVETHRGFATVQTKPGLGTTFRVYLPAAEPAVAAPALATAPRAGRGHGELILFVDDEPLICEAASAVLTNAGYRLVTAPDGAAAAALFAARPAEFALVITDRDMPVLDGGGLATIIRALNPAMRILAISGLRNSSLRHDGRCGEFADAFVPKPFAAETLLNSVEQLLHGAPPQPKPPHHHGQHSNH